MTTDENIVMEENVIIETTDFVFMSLNLGTDVPISQNNQPKNLGWGINIPFPGMCCFLDLDELIMESELLTG